MLNISMGQFSFLLLFSCERRYLSPEYATSGKLTEKADVSSFGLVALEIVSGRKVVDHKFEADKVNLLDWTRALYEKQQQLQIVDILGSAVSLQVNKGEVMRVVDVALLCTQLQTQERPSMSKVYSMLCSQLKVPNLPSSYTMPSSTSQPSIQLRDSDNADRISQQVEPH